MINHQFSCFSYANISNVNINLHYPKKDNIIQLKGGLNKKE